MSPSVRQEHWDSMYARKGEEEVTWFEPEAARSLELVSRCALPRGASITDIGGGASRLVRYDGPGIAAALGPSFALVEALRHEHVAPSGKVQVFTFARLLRT